MEEGKRPVDGDINASDVAGTGRPGNRNCWDRNFKFQHSMVFAIARWQLRSPILRAVTPRTEEATGAFVDGCNRTIARVAGIIQVKYGKPSAIDFKERIVRRGAKDRITEASNRGTLPRTR